MFIWKVPADNGDTTQTRHFTPLKNRLFLFQNLMSEVISGLVPTRVKEDNKSQFFKFKFKTFCILIL